MITSLLLSWLNLHNIFSQKPLNATLSTLFINFTPFDLESEVAICCGHTIEGLSH